MRLPVLLVEDHLIVREGLKSLLAKQPDIEVIAEAGDGRTALKLVQELSPRVVIMDVSMSDMNGIEVTRRIAATAPRVKVIGLSMYSDKRFIMGMLMAGASAYLPKDCAFEELVQAIRAVADDRTYLSPTVVDTVVKDYFHTLHDSSVLSELTDRQREVFQLLAEGRTVKEIAYRLSVSPKTVETHRQHIMNKLGVSNIAELTRYAIHEGLISSEP